MDRYVEIPQEAVRVLVRRHKEEYERIKFDLNAEWDMHGGIVK